MMFDMLLSSRAWRMLPVTPSVSMDLSPNAPPAPMPIIMSPPAIDCMLKLWLASAPASLTLPAVTCASSAIFWKPACAGAVSTSGVSMMGLLVSAWASLVSVSTWSWASAVLATTLIAASPPCRPARAASSIAGRFSTSARSMTIPPCSSNDPGML